MNISQSSNGEYTYADLPYRMQQTVKRQGDTVAYRVHDGSDWHAVSWNEYLADVEAAGRALIALGVSKGDVVCILGSNTPEWTTIALGAMFAGCTPAGIYFTCSAEEIAYILNHSEAPVLLSETDDHFSKVQSKGSSLPHLRKVVMMRGANTTDDMQISWDDFLALGNISLQEELVARRDGISGTDTGTLVYTSGTTGNPKAVMLSFRALDWTAHTLVNLFNVGSGDRLLSYLPLAHIAEAMNTIHSHPVCGAEIWFVRYMDQVADRLKEVRPTVFFAVPRVWQKVHEKLTQRLSEATGFKAKLAHWAIEVGSDVAERKFSDERVGGWLKFKHKIADKLILQKIRDALGLDLCDLPISGAAPIQSEIMQFMASLGITIYEVYGQSENCGPTTFNLPGSFKPGTVGRAIPGVEVKIAADDEVLVRGPNLLDGYAKDQEASAKLVINGWMHTGDLGRLDNQGFLTIIGRKKDILITSGGKNIAPAPLENDLMGIPLIEHAVVYGEGRNFLTALVTISEEALLHFKMQNNFSENDEISEVVRTNIQEHLDKINKKYARVSQIRKFVISNQPLTMESGELTATQKIRRHVVIRNNSEMLEALYAE